MSSTVRPIVMTIAAITNWWALPLPADCGDSCENRNLYAVKLVALDDPQTQWLVEAHPAIKGIRVVTLYVRRDSEIQQRATGVLSKADVSAITQDVDNWLLITFHESVQHPIELSAVFDLGPKTLVDSMCEYGKLSGLDCEGRSKKEECVDTGASANRCSDRNDFGCSYLFWSWTPPTCHAEREPTGTQPNKPTLQNSTGSKEATSNN